MPQPFCSVTFPTLKSAPTLTSARVIRAAFAHEMVVLRFRDRDLSSANYKSDVPLQLSWGYFPHHREEFYGYVHHVRPSVERTGGAPEIELVAVGATRVLRNELPRNWGSTRADLVVAQLATAARLGADVDASPVVRKNLMQPAESGWEFLRDLAEEDGYFLSSSGTLVHFWDLDARISKLKPHAPIFTPKRVEKFQPISGETNPSGREAASGEAYALDLSGKGAAYSDNFSSGTKALSDALKPSRRFSRVAAGVVLEDAQAAKTHLAATERRNKRVYQAEAKGGAHPPLRAGDPVVFDGYGARHSGFWVTDSVEFSLESTKITAKMKVSRAEAADDGARPTSPGTKSPARKKSAPRLVAGVWVNG